MLFYGTPAFAVPTLEALLDAHHVVAVVTQPDKPAGRGQRVTAPPVKERALAAGLPVLQPARLREAGWAERLAELGRRHRGGGGLRPDPAQGRARRPARGSINIHASLLPRYRGAAPIAWAIIRGETETGITTFQMDPGMDTGDMLLREATPIGPAETAGELAARLAPSRGGGDPPDAGGPGRAHAGSPGPSAGYAGASAQEGRRLAAARRSRPGHSWIACADAIPGRAPRSPPPRTAS